MKTVTAARLDFRGLTAAVVLGTLGALTIMIVPGFVMLVGAQSNLDDRQLGFIASWDINATAIAIGVSTFLIARLNWRHLALAGLLLIVIGNVLTAGGHTYPSIMAARICAGVGEGLAIAVSFAALGSAANPDRAFGVYLIVGLTVSAAVLVSLPLLQGRFGAATVFYGMAALTLTSTALLRWLPRANTGRSGRLDGTADVSKHLAVAGLVGVFLYFIAQGAVWSYFERIGAASGVNAVTIGEAMGLSSFAGMGGALVAVAMVTRCGRVWPLVTSGAISISSFCMLHGHVTGVQLITAGILFNFGWNLAQPLLSGVCSDADCRGRVVVAMGCIQTVGFGIGPALAAVILRGHDFAPSLWMSAAIVVVSLVIVIAGLKFQTRLLPATV
ncbi:MAG TPA: MFS transporter [Steroidobacteraceae bacterium]|nr:MFS transporter [Steroidobacteraceae bacterium]